MRRKKKFVPELKKRTLSTTVYVNDQGEEMSKVTNTLEYVVDTEHEFFLFFVHTIPDFNLMSPIGKMVYMELLMMYRRVDSFEVGGVTRKFLSDKIGCSASSIANSLKELRDNKFLLQMQRGLYRLNPLFVFQGSLQDRKTALEYLLKMQYRLVKDDSVYNVVSEDKKEMPRNVDFYDGDDDKD
jgi:hypothetical protein